MLRHVGKVDAGSARHGCFLACNASSHVRTALASCLSAIAHFRCRRKSALTPVLKVLQIADALDALEEAGLAVVPSLRTSDVGKGYSDPCFDRIPPCEDCPRFVVSEKSGVVQRDPVI